MRYTVDYSKLEGQAKIDKALEDIKDYLGSKKMRELERVVKSEIEAKRIDRLSFVAQLQMFVGIQGYPAEAWADHLGFPPYTESQLERIKEQQRQYEACANAEATAGLADRD